jgi:hypothetical protein
MEKKENTTSIDRFNILFEKLEEAKKEQEDVLQIDIKELTETYQTISLFKEFQESISAPSYSSFTKA